MHPLYAQACTSASVREHGIYMDYMSMLYPLCVHSLLCYTLPVCEKFELLILYQIQLKSLGHETGPGVHFNSFLS